MPSGLYRRSLLSTDSEVTIIMQVIWWKPGLSEFQSMSRKYASGLALAALLVVGTASADEPSHALPQLAGISTDLGRNASALTYWVDEADGIHVVTTIDTALADKVEPDADRHAVVRFSALILPGQSQVISVPGPVGSQQHALRIRRRANHDGSVDVEVDSIPAADVRADTWSAVPAE